ncbi:hypothetical protein B0187_02565 [Haemophilus paracuniculus]|uniref:Serine protease n=1 Tax=Haemophilus paracuniculus TaxID=734 RepID=A0A1T0ATL4_9PAST|nr:trypsin-like peptidase domain-containing protein [Haemophilus paracuniculus]OOR99712.1 hypothetical protein B0187_02565 [Haemophilus paracuniculus]
MKLDSIASYLYFTTVKIETSSKDGDGSGTGFIFDFSDSPEDSSILFLVTNRHVVENTINGKILFHTIDDNENGEDISLEKSFYLDNIPDWNNMWFYHPDDQIDIAICPLLPIIENVKKNFNQHLFFKAIPRTSIPSQNELYALDAIENVTFVGYPNGVWDSVHHLPILRKGTTASPLQIDFEKKPIFLIDASVFGGSSGSPLFLMDNGMYADKKGRAYVGRRFYFLGIVTAVYFRTQINSVEAKAIPTNLVPIVKNQEMIDLGVVFKSKMILETISFFQKRASKICWRW